jgi:hypothetical protein
MPRFERIQNAVSYQNLEDGNFQMRFKVGSPLCSHPNVSAAYAAEQLRSLPDVNVLHDWNGGTGWMQHEFKVDGGEVFFAFCFPWSLTDNETLMRRIEQKLGEKDGEIYFHRETLGYSLQRRPVEVITITSMVSSFAPTRPSVAATSIAHPLFTAF